MAKTKEERLEEVHYRALTRFDRIQTALRDERLQCLQDRRFCSIAGAQWEGPLYEQFVNKPRLEINKVHAGCIRIINQYRNNRIDVEFISKDGENRDQIAQTCNMLYRADEQDCNAEEAYDNAFEEAVTGGFGAWRVRSYYEDEGDPENDYQRICFEPIFDADSCVFFDLDAKRQDKSDAKFAFILNAMTREAYREEYDDDPTSWPKLIHQWEFDWSTPNMVFVCEYYEIEQEKQTVHVYRGLNGEEQRYSDDDFENDDELEGRLQATGFIKSREKKVKRNRVHKYLLNGQRVMEDEGQIAGEYIPIVPVYGKRWFIDNIERCMGDVRLSRDLQRLTNMLYSKLAEISALSTVQKPIFAPEQVAGHTIMWAEDNIQNFPYLLANPLMDAAGNPLPVQPPYTQPPQVPPSMAALVQLVQQDLEDIQGKSEAAEEVKSHMSGRAVEAIQQQLDMKAYLYISNFSKGMKFNGKVWLSQAKDNYIEQGRKMKGLNVQNKMQSIELMKPTLTDQGAMTYENDLSDAKLDIAVKVGPSSSSKREATVRNLTNMMAITQDTDTQGVLAATAMMNMEGEGLEDVRNYFRSLLLNKGVVKPTPEEAKQMQLQAQQAANQPPDPNSQFLQASAEQAQAEAAKARADTVLNIARSKESEAKTLETMSKINLSKNQAVMDAINMLHQHAQDEYSNSLKQQELQQTVPATD